MSGGASASKISAMLGHILVINDQYIYISILVIYVYWLYDLNALVDCILLEVGWRRKASPEKHSSSISALCILYVRSSYNTHIIFERLCLAVTTSTEGLLGVVGRSRLALPEIYSQLACYTVSLKKTTGR